MLAVPINHVFLNPQRWSCYQSRNQTQWKQSFIYGFLKISESRLISKSQLSRSHIGRSTEFKLASGLTSIYM